MGLVGYMKRSDRGRISTIGLGPKDRRKKIQPTKYGNPEVIYVSDCAQHLSPQIGVSVLLKQWNGTIWQDAGIAKCCPLCWLVLTPPDGIEPPQPLPVAEQPKKPLTRKQKTTLQRGRQKIGPTRRIRNARQEVLDYINSEDEDFDISVKEIEQLLGVSRQIALRHLKVLVAEKKIIREAPEHMGRGMRTFYRKAP